MRVRINGAWREVNAGNVRVGGVWRRLVRARAYVGNQWRDIATFIPPFSASVSPENQTAFFSGSQPIFSSPATVTPAGGVAPYAYAWNSNWGTGNITAPTSATTFFSRSTPPGEFEITQFRCLVTDAQGSTAEVFTNVTFDNTSSV